MKRFLKYSKFAFATLIVSSVFVACDDDDTEADNTFSGTYSVNTANIKSAGNAVDLGLSVLWADKNIGSSSESDNGILFVWGDVTGSALYTTADTYKANPTAISDLFNKYKGEEKSAQVFDTTKVSSIVAPIEFALDSASICDFVIGKLDELQSKYADQGILEATFSCGKDFTFLTYKNEDGDYAYRSEIIKKLDADGNVIKVDDKEVILSYFTKLPKVADTYSLTIELIHATAVKYFEGATLGDKYTEVKDQFGVVLRKEFAGGDVNGAPVNNLIANAKYDAATANWGADWQMPSKEQYKELIEKCTWEFTGAGYKVTGPSGESIFLPAAGFRCGNQLTGENNAGYYATGEIVGTFHFPSLAEQVAGGQGAITATDMMPNLMIFNYGQFDKSIDLADYLSENNIGVSIRPVKVKKL